MGATSRNQSSRKGATADRRRAPAKQAASSPDIYEYLDFRRFLADAFAARKAVSRKFSYRHFADKAGVGSPSYLKAVIDGQRNLSPDTARGFARAFDLSAQQTRFFLALVAFNQAKTTKDRAYHYEELSKVPRYRATRKLERSQYDYYSRWYCVVVRELVARVDFREDPGWIATQVRPSITPKQAEEALGLLLALGLVRRDDDGHLVQAEPLLTTGPKLRSLSSRSFHREMLYKAATALDEVPLDQREVGGVTLRLTAAQLELLKKRMYEIRQEVLQHDGTGEGDEAVFHFSFQLFPVSRFSSDEER